MICSARRWFGFVAPVLWFALLFAAPCSSADLPGPDLLRTLSGLESRGTPGELLAALTAGGLESKAPAAGSDFSVFKTVTGWRQQVLGGISSEIRPAEVGDAVWKLWLLIALNLDQWHQAHLGKTAQLDGYFSEDAGRLAQLIERHFQTAFDGGRSFSGSDLSGMLSEAPNANFDRTHWMDLFGNRLEPEMARRMAAEDRVRLAVWAPNRSPGPAVILIETPPSLRERFKAQGKVRGESGLPGYLGANLLFLRMEVSGQIGVRHEIDHRARVRRRQAAEWHDHFVHLLTYREEAGAAPEDSALNSSRLLPHRIASLVADGTISYGEEDALIQFIVREGRSGGGSVSEGAAAEIIQRARQIRPGHPFPTLAEALGTVYETAFFLRHQQADEPVEAILNRLDRHDRPGSGLREAVTQAVARIQAVGVAQFGQRQAEALAQELYDASEAAGRSAEELQVERFGTDRNRATVEQAIREANPGSIAYYTHSEEGGANFFFFQFDEGTGGVSLLERFQRQAGRWADRGITRFDVTRSDEPDSSIQGTRYADPNKYSPRAPHFKIVGHAPAGVTASVVENGLRELLFYRRGADRGDRRLDHRLFLAHRLGTALRQGLPVVQDEAAVTAFLAALPVGADRGTLGEAEAGKILGAAKRIQAGRALGSPQEAALVVQEAIHFRQTSAFAFENGSAPAARALLARIDRNEPTDGLLARGLGFVTEQLAAGDGQVDQAALAGELYARYRKPTEAAPAGNAWQATWQKIPAEPLRLIFRPENAGLAILVPAEGVELRVIAADDEYAGALIGARPDLEGRIILPEIGDVEGAVRRAHRELGGGATEVSLVLNHESRSVFQAQLTGWLSQFDWEGVDPTNRSLQAAILLGSGA